MFLRLDRSTVKHVLFEKSVRFWTKSRIGEGRLHVCKKLRLKTIGFYVKPENTERRVREQSDLAPTRDERYATFLRDSGRLRLRPSDRF